LAAILFRPCPRARVLAPSIAARHVSLRVPYVLSQFAVDAGPSWPRVGLSRPGQGVGSEGLEEKESSRSAGARGGHGGYADVPGEVSEQAFRRDASEWLQPTAEVVHHALGVPRGMRASRISPRYSSCRGPLAGELLFTWPEAGDRPLGTDVKQRWYRH